MGTEADNIDLIICCPQCGYDLRGTTSTICTECGLQIDREALAKVRIPWQKRAAIGRVRAFFQTIDFVADRPRDFAGQLDAMPWLADAKLFRWIVWLLLAIPLCSAGAYFAVDSGINRALVSQIGWEWMKSWGQDWLIAAILGNSHGLVISAMIGLWLAIFTGVQSYFFHPKRLDVVRQNRAVVLSYYLVGPIVRLEIFTVLTIICVGTVIFASSHTSGRTGDLYGLLYVLAGLPLIIIVPVTIAWIYRCVRAYIVLHRVATNASAWQTVRFLIILPILWLVSIVLCFILLPAMVGFAELLIQSN